MSSLGNEELGQKATAEMPTTMKAQHLDAFNTPYVLRENVPVPNPDHPYDLLIRVDAASYCHTDHVVASGDMAAARKASFPLVGCHEYTGTVVKLPVNSAQIEFKIGDRVGVSSRAYHPCGKCAECLEENTPDSDPKGYSAYCPHVKTNGISMDGGWREYALVDARQVAPIPPGLTQVEAAPLMCAGITIYAAIKKAGLTSGQRLGIIGCGGGLGHLGLQYATVMGLKVYGVDNSDTSLALVRNLNNISGATIIDSRTQTAAEAIAPIAKEDDNLNPGQFGLDAVIILPESQKAYQYGVDMLKDHGICVVVSFPKQGFVVSTQDLVFRDIRIIGSLSGSNKQLREMARFSAEHGIRPETKTYPIEELNELVHAYESGEAGKLVIDFNH
jgi:D-arabinose 1-dehydrogenase-like Zn-dependent alcohol dehydrogenase